MSGMTPTKVLEYVQHTVEYDKENEGTLVKATLSITLAAFKTELTISEQELMKHDLTSKLMCMLYGHIKEELNAIMHEIIELNVSGTESHTHRQIIDRLTQLLSVIALD